MGRVLRLCLVAMEGHARSHSISRSRTCSSCSIPTRTRILPIHTATKPLGPRHRSRSDTRTTRPMARTKIRRTAHDDPPVSAAHARRQKPKPTVPRTALGHIAASGGRGQRTSRATGGEGREGVPSAAARWPRARSRRKSITALCRVRARTPTPPEV
ncbi:hypothetical protein PsYK624_098600 [Phanerochaete sordida]|uniref:Uncharacterized protein n=1 Tax=Phanerochaete sordida TaxID=48140 RepID=A0A9P3LGJ5_9APHY|nr:hypothetical protein PsYK624_098600 [Phanerochaete sordida]